MWAGTTKTRCVTEAVNGPCALFWYVWRAGCAALGDDLLRSQQGVSGADSMEPST